MQNAHGSDANVVLWFLVRRQRDDWGLCGEQNYSEFLFEAMTRAKLRQHVSLEDLREEECLPQTEPYWTDGYDLGIR